MVKIMLVALLLAASSAFGEIYTWKDLRGTVHYTNSMHEIPARYMKRVKVLDLGTGQKADQATVLPSGQASSAMPVVQSAVQGAAENQLQQKSTELQPSVRSERIRRLRDARQQERSSMRRSPASNSDE